MTKIDEKFMKGEEKSFLGTEDYISKALRIISRGDLPRLIHTMLQLDILEIFCRVLSNLE